MKNVLMYGLLASAAVLVLYACTSNAGASNKDTLKEESAMPVEAFKTSAEWNEYWYQGLAELSSYQIQQGRYTESHSGSVVNIFVTEDFSKKSHLKLDNPSSAGADKLPILKLNQSLEFNTGIYPYSVMLSVYTPTDINRNKHAAKITNSVQDWCGMAYLHANNFDDAWDVSQFSYFESEGDRSFRFEGEMMEDELWTLIRIAPDKLPTGNMKLIPGMTYLRFSHINIQAYEASITNTNFGDNSTLVISYPSLKRKLSITYANTFPYMIQSWQEDYAGFNGIELHTEATLDKTIMLDYWTKHNNKDRSYRTMLGLSED